MTIKEAYEIIHPDTSWDKLCEIKFLAGFNGEKAQIKALNEASLIACEAMEMQEKLRAWIAVWKEKYSDGTENMTMKEVIQTLEEFEVES